MSFLVGSSDAKPKEKPKLLGLDEIRTATSEQARCVPYLCGRQRMSVTFISDAFNVTNIPVTDGAKKSAQVQGFNYFVDFGALVCVGPVDAIYEIWMSDERVWQGEVTRGVADYEEITIPDKGVVVIYWGTDTQTVDSNLQNSPGGKHSGYRNFCYLVFRQLGLGQYSLQVSNLEIVVARYPERPAWFTSAGQIGLDVNPALAIWDILTHPIAGPGIPSSLIDTDSLQDIAATLELEEFGISPIINRSQSCRQVLADILAYFDGYMRQDTAGKISFGLVRPLTDSSSLSEVSADEITSPLQIRPGTWNDTITQAQVRFTDSDRYYKENVVSADSDSMQVITDSFSSKVYDREWYTSQKTAAKAAVILANRGASPEGDGSVSVRSETLANLLPGDPFFITYPPLGLVQMRVRATEVRFKKAGSPEIDIEFRIDQPGLNQVRSELPIVTAPEINYLVPSVLLTPEVFELPAHISLGTTDPEVGFLAARPDGAHDRFWVWREVVEDSYQQQTPSEGTAGWSLRGGLTAALDATTTTIQDVTLSEWDKVLGASGGIINGTDIDSEKVVLKCGDEYMRVLSATLVSTGVYDIEVERGIFETDGESHADGDVVWVFHQERIPKLSLPLAKPTEYFKLQPSVAGRRVDIADVDPIWITLEYISLRPLHPENLRAFGDRRGPTYTTGQDIEIEWSLREIYSQTIWAIWSGGIASTSSSDLLIYNSSGTLVQTVAIGIDVTSYTLTNANLVAWLGSETTFSISLYQRKNGLRSMSAETLNIYKI